MQFGCSNVKRQSTPLDCAVNTTDRLSVMCLLMGVKHNQGTADVAADVAGQIPSLVGSRSQFLELLDCLVTECSV